ncbi:Cupredoxin [Spinellus fusiger]|nr:Cupredoxin [Spinellus fusiger]
MNSILTFALIILGCFTALITAQSYSPEEATETTSLSQISDNPFELLSKELIESPTGTTRTYYIAADEVIWNYQQGTVPKNKWTFACNHTSVNIDSLKLLKAQTTLGTCYYKALYREYTDATYTTLVQTPQWQGNMGPILRAQVGDTLQVHFWNRANSNFTMHPHGVFYEFDMEGAYYKGATETSFVAPGQNNTYVWKVPPRAGPGPSDGNSIVWGYHSHLSDSDINTGLYGAIIVYRPGQMTQEVVANEVVTTFIGFDENTSPYFKKTLQELSIINITQFHTTEEKKAFYISNVKQSINGLLYANPLDLIITSSTQWHLLGWGSYDAIYTVHWEHAKVSLFDRRVTSLRLYPASFKTVQVQTQHNGSIGVEEFKQQGMRMQFIVKRE